MKPKSAKHVRPETILAATATPIFLLDADRRVTFVNAACERETGWPAEELLGQTCDYATVADQRSIDALLAAIAPPPEVLAGQTASVERAIPVRSGEGAVRRVEFLPLRDSTDDGKAPVTSILGWWQPIDVSPPLAPSTPAQMTHAQLAELRRDLFRRYGTASLICKSEAMIRIAEQVAIARATSSAVLIHGERGTGKAHLARTIHYESDMRTRSFVPLDCSRLTAIELQQTFQRFFEQDSTENDPAAYSSLLPGTMFLTRIEKLPRDLQALLLEGFRKAKSTGRRLIAATTLEPAELPSEERLRSDFYHWLTPLCLALPPLRRRTEDIRWLAQHILEEMNRGEGLQIGGFSEEVAAKFAAYNWPGNVRELADVIGEARAACPRPLIETGDLPFRFRAGWTAQTTGPALRPQVAPIEPYLARVEKEQIENALRQCRQNKSKAADLLGLSRPRLYRRMEQLGIADEPEAAQP